MKVLLAVDGSECSQSAVKYFIKHRNSLGASSQVDVLFVDMPFMHRFVAAASADEVSGWHEENAQLALKPAIAALKRARVPWTTKHLVGQPGPLIAKHAQDGRYDMIVMGSHGQSGLKNLLLGSVVTKVLASCTVPVLIVR